MTRWSACFSVLVPVALLSGNVEAIQRQKSLYTTIDPQKCRVVSTDAAGETRLCDGLPDNPIYIATEMGRTFLSAGSSPSTSKAATQTLSVENSIFEGARRPTVEWRFIIRNEVPVPYAMIVRYFTRMDGQTGEVLVVTKLAEGEACQVARIDALANAEALVLARHVADQTARTFDCMGEPAIVGERGKSPM